VYKNNYQTLLEKFPSCASCQPLNVGAKSSSPSNNRPAPVKRTRFSRLKITVESQVCPDFGRETHLSSPFVLPAFHFSSIPSSTANRTHSTVSPVYRSECCTMQGYLECANTERFYSPLYTPHSSFWHRSFRSFSPQV
jgi:hypothetical protein